MTDGGKVANNGVFILPPIEEGGEFVFTAPCSALFVFGNQSTWLNKGEEITITHDSLEDTYYFFVKATNETGA